MSQEDIMNTLQDLFLQETQELLGAERQIATLLPQMAEMATSPDVKAVFQEHETQTQGQIQRLESLFGQLGQAPQEMPSPALQALASEAQQKLDQIQDPALREAFLIAAQQKVEHFEIACYGTARSHALQLDMADAADLLQQTLEEEKSTDERLSRLAENKVNDQADPQHVQGS
jgi:ferritin-like metal-binding protein YciE